MARRFRRYPTDPQKNMQPRNVAPRTLSVLRAQWAGFTALFLVLSGGVAYALDLAPDSVRSKHIKNGHVRSVDVADDSSSFALTGQDIARESLGGSDIGPDSLGGFHIASDSLGGSDIASESVGAGELAFDSVGAAELKGVVTRVSAGVWVDWWVDTTESASVTCPAGTMLIAGGHAWEDPTGGLVIASAPSERNPNTTWTVSGRLDESHHDLNRLYAWATCLQV